MNAGEQDDEYRSFEEVTERNHQTELAQSAPHTRKRLSNGTEKNEYYEDQAKRNSMPKREEAPI